MAASAIAGPASPNVFEHAAMNSKMTFVKNSGICETTPGVNQYSGYITAGDDLNMWFWFFEARENPQEAPLMAFFGGGPGDASEFGLFTQNGPCNFVDNETEPSVNPNSYNNYANMLYIDQPVGVGFTYGNATINSTGEAAPYVWKLLQAFYQKFPEYESRDFGILTESYGGHYGPEFARYIIAQNQAIGRGDISGEVIHMRFLSISNGWFDAKIQEKANIEYLYNNSYRRLINESFHDELINRFDTKCAALLDKCIATNTNEDCATAWKSYTNEIEYPVVALLNENQPGFFLGDIRDPSSRPSDAYSAYLQRPEIQRALGARVNFTTRSGQAGFYLGGDDARSFMDQLSTVIQAGVRVVIWTGDADYVSNWFGTTKVADTIEWAKQETFANQPMVPYTLNGEQKGTYKSLDNLISMRIFGAGHNTAFYQPELSLQIFKQTIGASGVVPT